MWCKVSGFRIWWRMLGMAAGIVEVLHAFCCVPELALCSILDDVRYVISANSTCQAASRWTLLNTEPWWIGYKSCLLAISNLKFLQTFASHKLHLYHRRAPEDNVKNSHARMIDHSTKLVSQGCKCWAYRLKPLAVSSSQLLWWRMKLWYDDYIWIEPKLQCWIQEISHVLVPELPNCFSWNL